MYDSVLVATDGTPGSESVVARALDLARTFEATVHALYVVDTRPEPASLSEAERRDLRSATEKRGRSATETVQERAGDLGLSVHREIREGAPHQAILEYADEADVDLVVVGTRGETSADRIRLGSTAERVIALADVPVLVVPETVSNTVPEGRYTAYDHVLIPTDGSDAAGRAAESGLEIAEHYGADVHSLYVIDTATYGLQDAPRSIVGLLKQGGENATASVAELAGERNVPATTEVLRGIPDEEILDYCDGVDADLIVMGTRGGGRAPDRLLGSVTARVVRHSSVPVLTIN